MDIDNDLKLIIHIEICLKNVVSLIIVNELKLIIPLYITKNYIYYKELYINKFNNEQLSKYINSIRINLPIEKKDTFIWEKDCNINYSFYILNNTGSEADTIESNEEELSLYNQWLLPAIEFNNLWESLLFDDPYIKENLLSYATTSLLFSDKNINNQLVSCNRILLFHGPPGTGKTSLCKALSQKLAIRFSNRYETSLLLEINAHSLFSKWFSESGKLVGKLFERIYELAEEKNTLVIVLIDEVESLIAARNSAMSGSDPSDAIRVVNAVLTCVDKLKDFENVLVVATSNLVEALDSAFLDRADLKIYLGNPSSNAAASIITSCIEELIRVGIIYGDIENSKSSIDQLGNMCNKLLSGRLLRKLPMRVFAEHIRSTSCSIEQYLKICFKLIEEESNKLTLLPITKLNCN